MAEVYQDQTPEQAPVDGEVKTKNRRPSIPDKVLRKLWVNASGRCQYDGCNKYLLEHALLKVHYNIAYVAHIIAAEPDGPRGDVIKSPELATDYDNLMLLCDECHRLADKEDVAGHPVERLTEMKKKHEARIQLVTGIMPNRSTNLVLYGANIGQLNPLLSYKAAAMTVLPDMFPANSYPVELSLENCAFRDSEPAYWQFHDQNLRRMFGQKVMPIIEAGGDQHFSIFAMAPMPLLIRLGTLLPDIYQVDVFQRHREPATWNWQDDPASLNINLLEPPVKTNRPVLNISLSATINDERIHEAIPGDLSIWTISIDAPGNNCMIAKKHLQIFREVIRRAMDRIKAEHGQKSVLNVFPAMPLSAAVEFGRVRMPKVDMPLEIYDHNKTTNTFIHALTID